MLLILIEADRGQLQRVPNLQSDGEVKPTPELRVDHWYPTEALIGVIFSNVKVVAFNFHADLAIFKSVAEEYAHKNTLISTTLEKLRATPPECFTQRVVFIIQHFALEFGAVFPEEQMVWYRAVAKEYKTMYSDLLERPEFLEAVSGERKVRALVDDTVLERRLLQPLLNLVLKANNI